jgi:type I restriction enzyme R subunit
VSETDQGVDDDPAVDDPPPPPGSDETATDDPDEDPDPWADDDDGGDGPGPGSSRKVYVDGVRVEILADLVHELDADGKRLRTVKYTEYAGDKVRSLYRSASELHAKWINPKFRGELLEALEARGIDVKELGERSGHRDVDPFDLLCHVAFNAPLRTRAERAKVLRQKRPEFWNKYSPQAREVLAAILDKYAEHGPDQMEVPAVLTVPPVADLGNPLELVQRFGSVEELQAAVATLQREIYEAA